MLPRNLLFFAGAAFAVVALWAGSIAAEPNFAVEGERLTRLGAEPGPVWTIRHPSVWKTKERTEQRFQILDPVSVGNRWFYAAGTALLELDPDRGVILDRLQFPAPILELKAAGDLVEMVVEAPTEPGKVKVTLRHRPGAPGPREVWSLSGWHQPFKDVSFLADPLGQPDKEFSSEARRAALDTVRGSQAQEPGNPFYAFFAGEQLAALGETTLAAASFDAARDNAGGSWATDVQLAMMFDERNDHDRGDVVFDRAMRKLTERDPTFTNSGSLVAYAMLMGIWSIDLVKEAVAARDFETVDRVQTRVTRLFPHLEQSRVAWNALAAWYGQNQRDELARKWRAKAEQASLSPWDGLTRTAREVDIAFALFAGFGIAAWLSAFAAGLRSTPREGRMGWLPRPRVAEIVGVLFTVALQLPLVGIMTAGVGAIGYEASAPTELVNEHYGSPAVRKWLESLEPSPARDELLAHGAATLAAYENGEPEPPPLANGPQLAERAISAAAEQTTLAALSRKAPVNRWFELPPIEYLVPPWAVLIAVMLVVGAGVRRRKPARADSLLLVIPGAARAAAPITGIMVGLFVAAAASILFGIDSILQNLAEPAFAKYYGIEALMDDVPSPSHAWAWGTLVVVAVLHAFTTWLDRR